MTISDKFKHLHKFIENIPRKYLFIIFGAVFLYLTLVFLGLNKHPLWGDEADTVWFGQSIISHGIPYGWDGKNFMGYRDGKLLNTNLVNNTSPWLQYYLEALSLKMFGFSTFSSRLPFVIFSIMSLVLLIFLTYKLTVNWSIAAITTILCGTSIPYILYSYQARYNPLTVFFSLLLVTGILEIINHKSNIVFILSGIGFFYSHQLTFVAFYSALTTAALIFYPSKYLIKRILVSTIIIILFTLPWLLAVNPFQNQQQDILSNFHIYNVLELVWRYLSDFNDNLGMPFIFLLITIFLFTRQRKKIYNTIFFLSLLYVLFVIFLSMLSIQRIDLTTHSDIRYAMNIYPVLIIILASLGVFLVKNKKILLFLIIIYILSNIFSLNFPVRFWWRDYINEITNKKYITPIEAVVSYLRTNSRAGDTVFITPEDYNPELINLYLNQQFIFVNRLSKNNPLVIRNIWLPNYLNDYQKNPDWIIVIGSSNQYDFQTIPQGIDLKNYQKQIVPVLGYDLSRPELFAHSFYPIKPENESDMISIYRYKNNISL